MFIPNSIDKKPDGTLTERAGIGEEGYAENYECFLNLLPRRDGVLISYYCEDDTYLSNEEIEEYLTKINNL